MAKVQEKPDYYKFDFSGIYRISFIGCNHFYIGSSINIKRRINEHIRSSKRGKHHNSFLTNCFSKYGKDNLIVGVIERCEKGLLEEREQHYIDSLNPDINICRVVGTTLGFKHSEESKAKMSKTKKAKCSMVGKKNHFYGKTHTQETKDKISKIHKGRKLTKEHRDIIVKNLLKADRSKRNLKGNENPRAKINHNDVIKIRQMIYDGVQCKVIAEKFPISSYSVSDIKNNRSWTHLKSGAQMNLFR